MVANAGSIFDYLAKRGNPIPSIASQWLHSREFLIQCCFQGIAIIRQLRQLEERTGRRIHELFDLICGTSTGGILAVALALKHFTLDECEQVYR